MLCIIIKTGESRNDLNWVVSQTIPVASCYKHDSIFNQKENNLPRVFVYADNADSNQCSNSYQDVHGKIVKQLKSFEKQKITI